MAENWANGVPDEGRSPESGHRMAAEGIQLPWRGNGSIFSANLEAIWGMSVQGPEQAEAFAVPANHCCRLYDRQGVAPIGPEGGDQDPEPAIGWIQSWSGCLPVQHGQLLAHCQAFEIRGSQRPIKPMQKDYDEQNEHLSHGREAIRPMAG